MLPHSSGLPGLACCVLDEGFGKGIRVFHCVGMLWIETPERIEGGGGEAGDAEGIKDMHGTEAVPRFGGDNSILALGSMQRIERSRVSRFGMIVPTPLPVRVGAMVRRWEGPA